MIVQTSCDSRAELWSWVTAWQLALWSTDVIAGSRDSCVRWVSKIVEHLGPILLDLLELLGLRLVSSWRICSVLAWSICTTGLARVVVVSWWSGTLLVVLLVNLAGIYEVHLQRSMSIDWLSSTYHWILLAVVKLWLKQICGIVVVYHSSGPWWCVHSVVSDANHLQGGWSLVLWQRRIICLIWTSKQWRRNGHYRLLLVTHLTWMRRLFFFLQFRTVVVPHIIWNWREGSAMHSIDVLTLVTSLTRSRVVLSTNSLWRPWRNILLLLVRLLCGHLHHRGGLIDSTAARHVRVVELRTHRALSSRTNGT